MQFNIKTLDSIHSMMGKTKARTQEQLVNDALSVYAWCIKQKESGLLIVAMGEDKEIELDFASLNNVSKIR